MKKNFIIGGVSLLLVLSGLFFIYQNNSKLVLKCTYTTNVIDKMQGYYDLGLDEKLLFINVRKQTINNSEWKAVPNAKVFIDKETISIEEGETLTHINRILGEYLETRTVEGKHYTSTGKCEAFNYKQRF